MFGGHHHTRIQLFSCIRFASRVSAAVAARNTVVICSFNSENTSYSSTSLVQYSTLDCLFFIPYNTQPNILYLRISVLFVESAFFLILSSFELLVPNKIILSLSIFDCLFCLSFFLFHFYSIFYLQAHITEASSTYFSCYP